VRPAVSFARRALLVLVGAPALLAGSAGLGFVPRAEAEAAAAKAPAALSMKAFELTTFDGARHRAKLGRLRVPEDRARAESPTITIAFVRLEATTAKPGPPIVFLAGGPGVPGTFLGRVPAFYALFERLRGLGDVILLDQRGTGISEPTLQCVSEASLPGNAFETEDKLAIALGGVVRVCAKMVRADGHAPEAYQTNASADDLEDLRVALGADRLRLLATDYGTELALAAVRRHGDRIDRIVLAGTRGPDRVWKFPSALGLHLKRIGRLVASDPRYANDLPDLDATVRRILDTLAWHAMSVEVTDAKTKKKVRLRVGPVGLQAALQSDISDGVAASLVPAMVLSLARGDSLLFARRIERLYDELGSGVSVMAVATDCASGGSPERIASAEEDGRTALLGGVGNLFLGPAFCDLVGNPDLGAATRAPLSSETPALFLTGANDGIAPFDQTEEVRRGFPQGIHLLVENGWHETLPAAAVQDAVVAFFQGENVRGRRLSLEPTRFLSVEEAKAAATKSLK